MGNFEMSEKLKPCPFCGGEAKLHIGHFGCSVTCWGCDIGHLGSERTREHAVGSWNTRHKPKIKDELKEMIG